MNNFLIKISHWWFGCAKFNLKNPHWENNGGKYAKCKICGIPSWWMYGCGKFDPDSNAQKVMGYPKPDETDEYWAKHRNE